MLICDLCRALVELPDLREIMSGECLPCLRAHGAVDAVNLADFPHARLGTSESPRRPRRQPEPPPDHGWMRAPSGGFRWGVHDPPDPYERFSFPPVPEL